MQYFKILIGFFFIILLNTGLYKSGIIEYFDYKLYDIISNTIKADSSTSKSSVVVVDIDEKSLNTIGQWPWSRVILANLIRTISSASPTSIGLDVIFAEPDKTSPDQMIKFYKNYFSKDIKIDGLSRHFYDNDEIFKRYINNSQTVLAVYLSSNKTKDEECQLPEQNIDIKDKSIIGYRANNILCNIEKIQSSSSSVGFINSSTDSDGIFRRVPLFMQYKDYVVPILGLAMFTSLDKVVLNREDVSILNHSIKIGENTEVLLNFYDKDWYTTISAVDLLLGKIDKNALQGKFVLLGTSAIGLHDRYLISAGETIAGVRVHATLIDNILHDELRYQPLWIKYTNIIFSIFLSLILLYYMLLKEHIKILQVFVVAAIIYIILSLYMLSDNIYLSSAYFLVPISVCFFIINIVLIVLDYQERKSFYIELNKAHSSAIDSMALVVESRDTETGAHIKRTKEYINCMCEYLYKKKMYQNILTKEYISLVYRASPLHDIGKVAIPDDILKKPGRLTAEEFLVMKEHPSIGKKILENALVEHKDNEFLKIALRIAHSHHEKWDGTGYPEGIKGEDIPLEARMMALADVYDALISRRVYKKAISFEETEQIIIDGRGTHFDPVLVDIFIVLKDKFKEIAIKIS